MKLKPTESPDAKSFLNKRISVKIDRPLGSKHPDWDIIYPINYGYIPNVFSPDGEELDVYVLGISEPLKIFTGVCIALIHRLDDKDDKLILAPENTYFSDAEIMALTEFQEKYFTSIILRSDQGTNS